MLGASTLVPKKLHYLGLSSHATEKTNQVRRRGRWWQIAAARMLFETTLTSIRLDQTRSVKAVYLFLEIHRGERMREARRLHICDGYVTTVIYKLNDFHANANNISPRLSALQALSRVEWIE